MVGTSSSDGRVSSSASRSLRLAAILEWPDQTSHRSRPYRRPERALEVGGETMVPVVTAGNDRQLSAALLLRSDITLCLSPYGVKRLHPTPFEVLRSIPSEAEVGFSGSLLFTLWTSLYGAAHKEIAGAVWNPVGSQSRPGSHTPHDRRRTQLYLAI